MSPVGGSRAQGAISVVVVRERICSRVGWGGDEQRLELVSGLTAGLDRADACDAQRPDRLDSAVAGLWGAGGCAVQRGAGSGVRVQRVGLAVPAGPCGRA